IDQVEQGRERLAQAHAAPATVADVEDALHLLLARGLVVELGGLPRNRMPGRCFEVAFAYRHAGLPRCLFGICIRCFDRNEQGAEAPCSARSARVVSRPTRPAPSDTG